MAVFFVWVFLAGFAVNSHNSGVVPTNVDEVKAVVVKSVQERKAVYKVNE